VITYFTRGFETDDEEMLKWWIHTGKDGLHILCIDKRDTHGDWLERGGREAV
jgi:hypothetical protein